MDIVRDTEFINLFFYEIFIFSQETRMQYRLLHAIAVIASYRGQIITMHDWMVGTRSKTV